MKAITSRTGRLVTLIWAVAAAGCGRSDRLAVEPYFIADCALHAEYFPPIGSLLSGDPDPFMSEFYAHQLALMGETSLYVCNARPQAHIYRLYWDRSLTSQPMAKLIVDPDGTGSLSVKLMDRECIPLPPGEPEVPCHVVNSMHDIPLTEPQVLEAMALLKRVPWKDSAAQLAGRGGMDGADWVFEERDGDHYQLADFRKATPAIQEFTRLVFWRWSHLLPADQQRTVVPGVFY